MIANADEVKARQLRRMIGERLMKDLAASKFIAYFQSIVALAPSNAHGAYREILVRFKEEEQNMQPPGMFLPVLEEHGLMPLLDRWMVSEVLRWGRDVQANLGARSVPRCSVNLSADTIHRDRNFGDFVLDAIRKGGVVAEFLSFEIPASEAHADPRAVARLTVPLRSARCTFALSDFTGDEPGFGLATLLGVAFVKMNGGMLSGLPHEPAARQRLDSINRRCHERGICTVCTQVEDDETLGILRDIGIDYAQGFGIERPRMLDFGSETRS